MVIYCKYDLNIIMLSILHKLIMYLIFFFRWNDTKLLYHDLLSVFENEILPTYNSSHIQYVIYYFISFKTTLAENFSNWLWKKCCDVSSSSTIRQAAAGYLASFLCRAPFIINR